MYRLMKKKSILMVTDSSYPNLTMNGVVMKNIIDAIMGEYHIDIISLQQRFDDVKTYQGIRIQYIKSYPYYMFMFREKRLKSKKGFISFLYGALTLGIRIFSFITRLISMSATNVVLTNGIRHNMNRMLQEKSYDYMLCIARPFEAFVAALPLAEKYRNTQFIGYQVDNFVTGEDHNYPSFLMKRRNQKRKEILNSCAKLFSRYFMLESIYRHEAIFLENEMSVKSIGMPLLIEKRKISEEVLETRQNKNRITFVYAGSLLQFFRPPQDSLDIMLKITKKLDICVDLYQRGDCNDILAAYEKQSERMIVNHGTVGIEQCYQAMMQGDILFAISNYAGDQISGKTFEYMSSGKPIIYFYYSEHDMNANLFEEYGLSLCVRIDSGQVEKNADRVIEFAKMAVGKTVPFEEVKRKFARYTPERIVEELF